MPRHFVNLTASPPLWKFNISSERRVGRATVVQTGVQTLVRQSRRAGKRALSTEAHIIRYFAGIKRGFARGIAPTNRRVM